MQTVRDIAPFLTLGVAVVVLGLFAAVLVLMVRLRRLRRAQIVVMGRHGQRDIVAHSENLDSQVRNQREAVEILTTTLEDHKRHLDHALTNRAVVRFDAFRDTGGEQSSAMALLDNFRSGLVLTTISARDFARIYMKIIENGVADRELSPEESEAVERAVPRPLTQLDEAIRAVAPTALTPNHEADREAASGSGGQAVEDGQNDAIDETVADTGSADDPHSEPPDATQRQRIPLADDWGDL